MNHHTHAHPHAHTGDPFQSERMAALLEAEADLAAGVTQQVLELCVDELASNNVRVERVADLGCGPGVATSSLAQAFEHATVVGVDASSVMLRHANARAERLGVGARVETRELDLNGALQSLGNFDLVWVALTLHHAQDEQTALTNFAKLLRPRGLFCLLERSGPVTMRLTNELGQPGIWHRVETAQAARYEYSRRALPGIADVNMYAEMIGLAGLELLDSRTLTDSVTVPTDESMQPTVQRYVSTAVRNLSDALPQADVDALTAALQPGAEIKWGDAAVASSRSLFIARGPKQRPPHNPIP